MFLFLEFSVDSIFNKCIDFYMCNGVYQTACSCSLLVKFISAEYYFILFL